MARRKVKNKIMERMVYLFSFALFSVYVFFMTKLLFFRPINAYKGDVYNLIPFKTIERYILSYQYFNFYLWFSNLFGNIIAFVPLGILVPIVFKKTKSFKSILLISFSVSLFAEIIQFLLKVGEFDVDDLILNTLGGLFGFAILKIISRIGINKKEGKKFFKKIKALKKDFKRKTLK